MHGYKNAYQTLCRIKYKKHDTSNIVRPKIVLVSHRIIWYTPMISYICYLDMKAAVVQW